MANPKQNRRRTIVINPQLQKRMVVTMSVAPALGLSAMMVSVCYFCYIVFEQSMDLGVQIDGLMPLFLSVAGFILVAALFLVSNAVMVSHRVAGPAHRLCESLKQMRGGNLGLTVNFRDGDYLVEVQDELNLLLDVLNENPPKGFTTRAMKAAARDEEGDEGTGAPTTEAADAIEAPNEGAAALSSATRDQ